MSGLKVIRRRITSVKNTKQITRAMKLVSAAKLRRAQEAAENGRFFGKRLGEILAQIIVDLPEGFSHPLLQVREDVKTRRIVVIAGERGLCGGYNANVIKAVRTEIAASDANVEVVSMGRRVKSAASRLGWNEVLAFEGLAEDASRWPAAEIVATLMEDFASGKCDEVVLFYTRFKTAVSQVVTREVLLPFVSEKRGVPAKSGNSAEAVQEKTKYDPMPKAIVEQLLPQLVRTKFYQAGLESKASEHAARMSAMDSATRNADELIERLRLFYNRARQSAITRELIDIVGGAEAIK